MFVNADLRVRRIQATRRSLGYAHGLEAPCDDHYPASPIYCFQNTEGRYSFPAMMTRRLTTFFASAVFIFTAQAAAEKNKAAAPFSFPTVDKLPLQTGMPDPFLSQDGRRVEDRKDWPAQRDYLKAMLAHYQYGTMPPQPGPDAIKVERVSSQKPFPDHAAVLEKYAVTITQNDKSVTFHFEIIHEPGKGRQPVIIKNGRRSFLTDDEAARDDLNAAKVALERGYVLCKFQRTELAKDARGDRVKGVYPLYPEYDWGAIAVWAWAHGVVADALDKLEIADMDKLVATGHSRGGKAALCAGIYDERIAITAPNSSGTGGTGSMRYFEKGQREQRLILHRKAFPHWWVDRLYQFGDEEDRLPFDAHTAKALVAPRALFNTHARQDYWANPYGTELTYRAANRVFDWLGAEGKQGIHWRDGGHAQNATDWGALFDFADWQFHGKEPEEGKAAFSKRAYPDAKLPVVWVRRP